MKLMGLTIQIEVQIEQMTIYRQTRMFYISTSCWRNTIDIHESIVCISYQDLASLKEVLFEVVNLQQIMWVPHDCDVISDSS